MSGIGICSVCAICVILALSSTNFASAQVPKSNSHAASSAVLSNRSSLSDHGRLLVSAALNGACISDSECFGANQVCSTVCLCAPGYSGTSTCVAGSGGYFANTITYSSNSPQRAWDDIVVSSDFMTMVACDRGDFLVKSVDSGKAWFQLTGSGQRDWETITGNDDLTKIAAATDGNSGRIWLSTDSGTTFNALSIVDYFHGVAATNNFVNIAASVWGGNIYASTDSGATFTALSAGMYA